MNNNAKAILQTTIVDINATLIPIPSGRIGLFSDTFPYVVTYEKTDSIGKVTGREIMLCTSKSGNNLVVTRRYETCPVNDDAITQTQSSITLEAGGIIEARITGGMLESKAENSEVVHLAGDEIKDGDLTLANNSGNRKLKVESSSTASIDIIGDKNNSAGEPGGAGNFFSIDGGSTSGVTGITNTGGKDYLGGAYEGATANGMLIGTKTANPVQFGYNNKVRFELENSMNFRDSFPISTNGIGGTIYGESWHKIGTLFMGGGARVATLIFNSGGGYNGQEGQQMQWEVNIKTGNSTAELIGINSIITGGNNFIYPAEVIFVQIGGVHTYDVVIKKSASWIPFGATLFISGTNGISFTKQVSQVSDPGTGSTIKYAPKYTTFTSQISVGEISPTESIDTIGKMRMRSETSSLDASDIVATKGYVDGLVSGVGGDEEVVVLQAGETILSGKPISIGTNGLAYNMTTALGYYGISKNGASSGGSITVMKRGTFLLSAPKKIGSSTTLFTEANESTEYNIPDGGSRDYSFTPASDMLVETISVKKASPASQNATRIGLEIRQGGTSLGTFFTGYSQATAFAVFTIGINLALTGGVTYTFRITKDPNSANPDGAIIKQNAGSTMFTTSIVGRPFNVDMIVGDPLCLNSSLVYSGGGLNLPYVIGEMIGVNTFKILRGLQGGFISVGTGSNAASQAGYVYYNSGTATINGIGITGGAGYVKKGDIYTLSAGGWFSPIS